MTLTLVAFGLLLGAAAPQAAADERAGDRRQGGYAAQAAYLAEQLRKNPVYVSDQVPRAVPRSAAPRYARIAERTGVPTYVAVLPGRSAGTEGHALLDAVHARTGERGLYVLLDEERVDAAKAYGVDVPARDALATVLYETPEDAGSEHFFDRFVTVLTSGDAARLKQRAENAHGPGKPRPEEQYLDRTVRLDRIALAAVAVIGVPLAVFLCAGLTLNRRTERRARAAAAAQGSGGRKKARKGSGPLPKSWDPATKRLHARIGYACVGLGTALLAGTVFLLSGGSWKPDTMPTRADLDARAQRVAQGLAQAPVYSDPESPSTLSEADRSRLEKRIAGLDVPMYVVEIPNLSHAASNGDLPVFAEELRFTTGRTGVYAFADPVGGDIAVTNCGTPIDDTLLWDVPLDVEEPFGPARNASDLDVPDRLDRLVRYVGDIPEDDYASDCYALDAAPAVEDDALPSPLTTGVFWTYLLAWGPLLAFLPFMLLHGVHRLLDRRGAW
ncbi:hypothetical protein RM572_17580 [Streptomyces sp. DSM 42041]|uniref:DUF4350 domain-containing protein n=1 Tax=Streptomyces hazeniae TaxID=3075538 RepID=A0ABU2NX53_9ACTN|nr:hypothetical protein [Streptomyces sp. DSM 42041]MDT0380567.1 hypothetical protein [Streptomyces sp. DSM 42041]